jgi:hypothetical protein
MKLLTVTTTAFVLPNFRKLDLEKDVEDLEKED